MDTQRAAAPAAAPLPERRRQGTDARGAAWLCSACASAAPAPAPSSPTGTRTRPRPQPQPRSFSCSSSHAADSTDAVTAAAAAVAAVAVAAVAAAAAAAAHRKAGKKSRSALLSPLAALLSALLPLLILALALGTLPSTAYAQRPASSSSRIPSSTSTTTTTNTAAAGASPSPSSGSTGTVTLLDYTSAQSSLQVNAASGIFFNYRIPINTTVTTTTAADGSQVTARVASTRLSVSISLCGGPSIPPYDLNNATLVKELSSVRSAAEVRQRTLVRAYWTSSKDALAALAQPAGSDVDPTLVADATQPGPTAQSASGIKGMYLSGGAGLIQTSVDRDVDNVFTLGIWPPEDIRDVSTGAWTIRVIASMDVAPELVSTSAGVSLDDTDQTHALVTSEVLSNVSPINTSETLTPNVTLYVLPSLGPASLDPYFNSSLCALEQKFAAFSGSGNTQGQNLLSGPLIFNISATKRGIVGTAVASRLSAAKLAERVRMEILVNNLVASTNYTAWLRWTSPQYPEIPEGVFQSVLYPAIKFLTKTNANCRLIRDLDFCPSVAYSIPIAPDVNTAVAVAAANLTVGPNMANFTRTIDTFPCGNSYYGQYSFVSTCDDCKNAYRDWLCAVALPRCTDPVQDPATQSAASQTGADLTGADSGTNTRLLPYIVNRNVNGSSTSDSRRPYVDTLLKPGAYGELLPCIYTCHFVARACPPIAGWSWGCPVWDISAQRDYGTFVDAGPGGIGADLNGGDGSGPADTGKGRNATNVSGAHSNSTKGGANSPSSGKNNQGGDNNDLGPDGSGSGSSSGSSGSGGSETIPGLNQVFTSRGDDLAKGAGQRWGGISRYVATDAFGNQYCNALGIDLVLRQQNGGRARFSVSRVLGVSVGWAAGGAGAVLSLLVLFVA